MLDLLYHLFNYTISICYFIIFILIFRGLITQRLLGRNPLGTATSGIFLTCSLGHFAHAFISHAEGNAWELAVQVVVDGWTVVPAIAYVVMRRRYGLIVRGPDMINEFRTQIAQQSAEIKVMKEVELLKDDFLAMASHELRTPLTTIKGYAQYLQRQLGTSENKKTNLAVTTINQQVERMSGLVDMLLDVSRIQSGKVELQTESVEMNKFVVDLAERLQITSPKHQLNVKLANFPVWVKIDVERIEQVANNLVNNAIKYSPNAFELNISVEADEADALFSVTDYGMGIPHEELPKIFDRFYRSPLVKNSTMQGLGLGLYISSQIVQVSGGEITVKSILGEGSTFTVCLPRVAAPREAQNALLSESSN